MKMKKIYLQCGYENDCPKRDCLNCYRKIKIKPMTLTQAELCAIEDFAVVDLDWYKKERPEEFEMVKKIMYKVMMKVFKAERRKNV